MIKRFSRAIEPDRTSRNVSYFIGLVQLKISHMRAAWGDKIGSAPFPSRFAASTNHSSDEDITLCIDDCSSWYQADK
jgi:hypothetical protein